MSWSLACWGFYCSAFSLFRRYSSCARCASGRFGARSCSVSGPRQTAGTTRTSRRATARRGTRTASFFYSALVLTLALILTVVVLAGMSDASVLRLLPCLVVAALCAWNTIRKYAARYGWAERERVIRARARGRELHRTQLAHAASRDESPRTYLSGMRIHPALLNAALFSRAVIVTVVFVAARPQDASGLAVAGLLALLILVLLPKVVRMRRREQVELDAAASSVTSAFSGGAVVHPVRYGLGESDSRFTGSMSAAWDAGPSRTGALAVDSGALLARGTDGAALDLQLAEVQGAVLIGSGVAWLPPSVDVLLRSGEAIECRSPHARAITEALSDAGLPVTTA